MIRPKVGIFGRMNVGKSTLLNHITGQRVSIVNPQAGTTTDPVRRTVEVLDFAPVVFIDTAGYDDTSSELGRQRVAKSMRVLAEVDMVILVADGELEQADRDFLQRVTVPYIIVRQGVGYDGVLEAVKVALPLSSLVEPPFFGDRLRRGDTVVLVCPIDSEAPSGRLILPQVQALRAALDVGAVAVVVQPTELKQALVRYSPSLVVTDSQAFAEVNAIVDGVAELTSFSILLSERKGDPVRYGLGLEALKELRSGDRVLMVEHCTHQSSCDDIARVKIPALMRSRLGVELEFGYVQSLAEVAHELQSYSLVVQCGGCMTNRRAVISNIDLATRAGVPITNYGMLLCRLQLFDW